MKKNVFLIFILFYVFSIKKTHTREVRNVIPSKLFIGLKNKGDFSIEASINLKSKPQFYFNYLISNKIAVFNSYNLINWKNKRHTIKVLFESQNYDFLENKNNGYTFGVGFLHPYSAKKSNQLEFLLGFENQHLNIVEYHPTKPENLDLIAQKYSKLFFQINSVCFLNRFTVKNSYFHINNFINILNINCKS